MTVKREKRDRLWLVVAVVANIALAVTLNRYSTSLPIWVVLGLWGVAAALFFYWLVRAETTRDWFNRRFRAHPISYVLALLIFLPFFCYATSVMLTKLRAPKPANNKDAVLSSPGFKPQRPVQTAPSSQEPKHETPLPSRPAMIAPKLSKKSAKASQSAVGAGNQQVQTGDNGVVQTMTGSPGGLQVGHDLTVIGPLPPPDRDLSPADVQNAVKLLQQAPEGTQVAFVTYPTQVPEDSEISRFTAKLERVFSRAGWYPYRERNYFVGSVTMMGNNGMSHGEGIGCSAPAPPTQASKLAEQAMAILHFPCTHPSVFGPESTGGTTRIAFYVSIGHR